MAKAKAKSAELTGLSRVTGESFYVMLCANARNS